MSTTVKSTIEETVDNQREFFASGRTLEYSFRKAQLLRLREICERREKELVEAVQKDLGKHYWDAYMSEVGSVAWETRYAIRRLKRWMRPKRVNTPASLFPSSAMLFPEPLGCSLVIGAYNYPIHLVLKPLVGAIAAGDCCIIKPPELAKHSAAAVARILSESFDPGYIAVVEGGSDAVEELLTHKFDHIFYTGSARVGRIVMSAAARHLTPVVLELGGKNPCIVHEDAMLGVAARRIVWAKYFNAGQTCLAPDYLLVHKNVREQLVAEIEKQIGLFYGGDPRNSPHYDRIIDEAHTRRTAELLKEGEIISGGDYDSSECYIEPTIIRIKNSESRLMKEEVFGPLLPIIEYSEVSEIIEQLSGMPKPLALYLFTRNRKLLRSLTLGTSSGALCVNDLMVHAHLSGLPFGGVGESGLGSYHGKASFGAFSHHKPILKRFYIFDWKQRYPPHVTPGKLFKKMVELTS